MIGASPRTGELDGLVGVDDKGFLAIGDVRSGSTKRVASAVGDGALVVRSMHEALSVKVA